MLGHSDTSKTRLWLILLGVLFIFSTSFLGFIPDQSDFNLIASGYLLGFAIYFIALNIDFRGNELNWMIGLAIFARLILTFSFPNFSDDIYRFIWDGQLISNGLNPFEVFPKDALDQGLEGISHELYEQLNSQEYYTIYPPVSQAIFFLSTCFSDSWQVSSIIMKVFMLAFEIGSIVCLIKILAHLELPKKNILIYALNPLIIIEIMGNLHFEGAMIFFLLAAYYLLLKSKFTLSGVLFGLAVCSKLLPLLFLPSLFRRISPSVESTFWKKLITYYFVVGATILVCFLPLLSETFFLNFANSLDLYFRKFEFNASIYYLLRAIGDQIAGYNLIAWFGPILGILSLSFILGIAFFKQKESLQKWPDTLLITIVVYLLFTTTVHPWYLSLPIVLCCLTSFRFPIIWSALICLTYFNYAGDEYHEHLWLVAIEYGVLFGLLVYEVYFGKRLILTMRVQ